VSDSPAFIGCAVGVSAVTDADVVACVVDVGVASLDSRTVNSVRRTSSIIIIVIIIIIIISSSSSPSHCILFSLLRQPLCNYPLQENHADKKLCYRKQIARELRTQYVDGIYSNIVTLQYGLEVTQDHGKWRHSIDCIYELLLAFHSNYGGILYRLRIARCDLLVENREIFIPNLHLAPPWQMTSL